MKAFRTFSHIMTERLDVNYYKPIFIENQRKIELLGTKSFKSLYLKSGIGHTASVEPHYSKNNEGISFIAGKSLKQNQLLLDIAEKITFQSHYEVMAKSRLKPSYLLLVRKGNVGNACVVPVNVGELNCSSEIMFFAVKSSENSYYLVSFFNSQHGTLAIKRLERGSLIPGVSLNDIPDLQVVYPLQEAQAYIGDKVRMAERLRERSQYLVTSAKLLIEALLEKKINEEELELAKKALEVGDRKTDYQILNKLNENIQIASHEQASKWVRRCHAFEMTSRIDCHFYNPDASSEIEKVKKCNPKPLSDYVVEKRSEPPIHTDHYSENGIAIVSPANFTDFKIELEGTNKLNPAYKELFGEFLMQEGNIIFSLVGDVGHACVVPEPAPLAISYRRTAQIKLKGINPYLVATFLNCRTGDLQLKRMTTGVIQAQLRLEDSVEVLIPSWTIGVQNYIGDKVWLGLQMQEQVEYLTTAAKLLVEALIEGKLTEDELKTAQISLQKGDREPDKAILSRLTRKGIDIKDEPPLFPDIDALYEIIDQISKDGEEET